MESGNSPSNAPPSAAGRLTDAERQAMRERSAQARAATSAAIERYAVLLARSRQRLAVSAEMCVAIDATRETLRESVQRYAQLLKALDTSPEHMLGLVKETLREQLPHPEAEEATKVLAENVVTWCIEGYYQNRDSPAA